MKKSTILNQKMSIATTVNEAWHNGEQYFHETENGAYLHMDKEALRTLLSSASMLQQESGYICLYEDSTMPIDARVDMIYRPSYAIASIAIFAYLKYPDIFDEHLEIFLRKLLDGAFRHGIIGHGIESDETVRRSMLMLCKAGVRSFLTRYHKEHLSFARAIHHHMTYFEELSERIDAEDLIVTANSFSAESINHQIKELVAHWNGNTHPLFVYGTLMQGQRAHHMLSGCEFGGSFQLKDYAMYNLGAYPGIQPCSNESVLGELYFVSDDLIAQLDQYECEGKLYRRVSVQLCAGSSTFVAETYVYNKDTVNCKKVRECWNADAEDLVWYAGYGSNLSSERFSCYISGGTCAENGRTYPGSSDPTPALAMRKRSYPGELYFGNSSSSWNGCGVAFFDPVQKSECDFVYMKCYLITRQQLHDVMAQEGSSPNWYGRLVCLEVDDRGIPVYTLTSENRRPPNDPDPAYVGLIATVLEKEFELRKRQISTYLRRANKKL